LSVIGEGIVALAGEALGVGAQLRDLRGWVGLERGGESAVGAWPSVRSLSHAWQ
jgi:hypothetical protein